MKRIPLAAVAAFFLSAATTTITVQPGDSVTIVGVPTPAPMVLGPVVDKSRYATVDPSAMYRDNRIQSVYNKPINVAPWWAPCVPGSSPDCTAAPSNIANQNLGDIGAFREAMMFAGMSNDDPIVFPGQQGASHSHTFFGNFVDYRTTSANIRDSAWCASAGGKLNCTSIWISTVVDTKDGAPMVPASMNFYYKGSDFFAPSESQKIVAVPVGLHMIAGDPKNTDPSGAKNTQFVCYGPNGENPGWKGSITAAFADGTCRPGGELVISTHFPPCWDGVNLDSADHKSHMAAPVQLQQAPFTWSCPSTHPVQIPTLSTNAHYPITDPAQVGRWRLSSDMYDPSLPAGLSGHADYMMGWDPTPHPELWGENKTIVEMWTTHCLNEQRDCHNFLIGDNLHMLF